MKKLFGSTATALLLLIVLAGTVFAATGVSNVKADEVVTTDAIAGTWYGNMHFSATTSVQRIKLAIPAGCEPGDVCGTIVNYPVQCTWEVTYDGFSNDAYQYHFSNTLDGNCPAGSTGSLTLMPDGTLYRIHQTPQFSASGHMRQLPNAWK